MKILDSILKTFVGDKKKKDLKLMEPIVGSVHTFDNAMAALSNDELRGRTASFKDLIKEGRREFEAQISELEKRIESAELDEKESLYDKIDKLNDESYKKTEEVLNEIQGEAFAVMKETAARFFLNVDA